MPLIAIGTFGGHILPKAGDWMNAVKYAFGFILLAVAVYLATPHLPYYLVVALYTLLMLVMPLCCWSTDAGRNAVRKLWHSHWAAYC